jgi:hypothetical protein
MTKMTHRINLTVVVKIIDLNASHIYNCNHMVGMDKISSNEITGGKGKGSIQLWGLIWTSFIKKRFYTHKIAHLANLWKNLETTHN